ncbi:unnamed protein product, partial [Mesorhabditis belari]|uniref:Uncharacterized protein n=1 Tax=Mesorhabditis belari TaxID=2138241 RepID=A0AAF3EE92_9BILA
MFKCFLFGTVFRTALAFLAHFNWLAAFKIKCVYVIYWKSFDLFWFWMHLFLCSCFRALRRENYKVIWWNLMTKRCTTHKAYSIKEIYMMIYGQGSATQSEVELERIDNAEKKELKDRAFRRSMRSQRREKATKAITAGSRKFEEVSSDSSTDEEVEALIKSGLDKKKGWKAANIRQTIQTKYRDLRSKAEEALLPKKEEGDEAGTLKGKKWELVKGIVEKVTSPKVERRIEIRTIEIEEEEDDHIYPLYPDYSNIFDVNDQKNARKRERKDVRVLRKRVRDRVRKELEEKAEDERRRKLLTDAIDLLLNMLRMVTMFALVTWNIRKHNPLASFKHLEIDFDPEVTDQDIRDLQMGYVNPQWVLALSVTVFLDVFMSFLQFMIAYYQQFQLLKRMGFWWSFLWTAILVIVSLFGMVLPMVYLLGSLDLSWCRIMPNTDLACWMPPHWVDFPLRIRGSNAIGGWLWRVEDIGVRMDIPILLIIPYKLNQLKHIDIYMDKELNTQLDLIDIDFITSLIIDRVRKEAIVEELGAWMEDMNMESDDEIELSNAEYAYHVTDQSSQEPIPRWDELQMNDVNGGMNPGLDYEMYYCQNPVRPRVFQIRLILVNSCFERKILTGFPGIQPLNIREKNPFLYYSQGKWWTKDYSNEVKYFVNFVVFKAVPLNEQCTWDGVERAEWLEVGDPLPREVVHGLMLKMWSASRKWMALEGGGHRSPDGYSDFADHSLQAEPAQTHRYIHGQRAEHTARSDRYW